MKENMLYGVHIGEHGFDPEGVINEINERVIKPGYNFVTIRTRARFGEVLPHETYVKWAEYLAENKIYFLFLYTLQTKGQKLVGSIEPRTVEAMKEIAGEYFLGDMIGELGSCFGAKHKGYGGKLCDDGSESADTSPYVIPSQKLDDMRLAAERFVEIVNDYVQFDRKIGMPHVSTVEPTALSKYIMMGGVDLPMLELMCSPPDILLPYIRGVSRAFDLTWGTYMAHEWYGGARHSDPLKRKRLELGMKYAYLSGSSVFCIESGDECITAYGEGYGADSEICRDYRNSLDRLKGIADSDGRPKSGPRVRVAFVSGRYDPYASWGGSSAWGQYYKEEWGHGEAEHSWRLLHEIGQKRQWWDIENFGEEDLSAAPAYGSYDILPIEADVDAFARYDYLIFVGWSTMTDGDMDKLTEYVRRGGNLLMSMAHLNYSAKRAGERIAPPSDRLRELFGVELTGKTVRTNAGVKFMSESAIDGVIYPKTGLVHSDPILTGGYVDYAEVRLAGATPVAMLSDGFVRSSEDFPPAVVENRLGKGVATLVTSLNYPGHPAAMPLYRVMLRELVTASARTADIKVISSDKLRYSVYEDGGMYLLNTDYDLPLSAKIRSGDRELQVTVEPLELKKISV